MLSFGQKIRDLRQAKQLPLRKVAAYLDMDPAILSKIERGKRKASRQHVKSLAEFYETDLKELMVSWLSDKIVYELAEEEYGAEALKVAEEQVQYLKTPEIKLQDIKKAVSKVLKKHEPVTKAWIFGSFARNEATYKSDVDLIIDVPSKQNFSYFDLFEIQHNLEEKLHRKIDITLSGTLKPFAWETAKEDLKLIYEKS